jgi:hypothetical protein
MAYAPAAKEDSTGLTTQERRPELHIHVDIKSGRFAAYQFRIKWDPKIARIVSLRPCRASAFPANPECDPSKFSTGEVIVLAASTLGYGVDNYHLLTVTFERVSAGTTPVEVIVEALYDDSEPPRRADGVLEVTPREISFP